MRALMASYYGVAASGTQEEWEETQDARNIDVAAFDPDRHVRELLSEKSLPELVAFQESLAQETKTLDKGMQSLVYDNYNKFISATDTVRHMKDSVGDIETEMQRLSEKMEHLDSTSATVDSHLAPNRRRIEQLVGVRRLLQKLEFLFKLPDRLSRSVELEAYGQAVHCYTTAAPVLRRHAGDIPSLDAILQAAEGTIQHLREILVRQASDLDASGHTVGHALEWLLQLGEPVEVCHERFLAWARWQLDHALEWVQTQPIPTAEEPEPNGRSENPPDPDALIQSLLDGFLDRFVDAADSHRRLFGRPRQAPREEAAPDSEEDARRRTDTWEQFSRDIFGQFFAVLRTVLTAPWKGDDAAGWQKSDEQHATAQEEDGEGDEEGDDGDGGTGEAEQVYDRQLRSDSAKPALAEALERCLRQLRVVASHIPYVRIVDRASEVAEECVRAQISRVFVQSRAQMTTLLRETGDRAIGCAEESDQGDQGAGGEGGANPHYGSDVRPSVLVGRRIRSEARAQAETMVSIMESSLHDARHWVILGMRALPDLARAFVASVEGHSLQTIVWMAAAVEALVDAFHPARSDIGGGCVETPGAGVCTDWSEDQTVSVTALRRRVRVALPPVEDSFVRPPQGKPLGAGPLAPLFLACLSRSLAEHGVNQILSAMIRALPSTGDLLRCDGVVAGAEEAAGMTASYGAMMDVPLLIRRLLGAGRTLLRSYVRAAGDHTFSLLQKSFEAANWIDAEEPRGARLVVPLVARAVAQSRPLVAAALGETIPAPMSASSSSSSSAAHGATARRPTSGQQQSKLARGVPSRGGGKGAAGGDGDAEDGAHGGAGGAGGKGQGTAAAAALHRDIEQLFASGGAGGGGGRGGGRSAGDRGGHSSGSPSPFHRGRGGRGRAGGSHGGRRSQRADTENRPANQEGAEITGPAAIASLPSVLYTSESIVAATLRRAFYSMALTVRGSTLGAHGFQQLQVDIATLWLLLHPLMDDPRSHLALEQVLDDALASAAERTIAWEPLDQSIVFMLANNAVQEMDWDGD